MSSTTLIPTQARVHLSVRVLGAILLLFVGADHYYEYSVGQYSVLPTIGTLFLLNFISATVVGVLLLMPLDRMSHRHGGAALKILAASGFGIAASSLAALLVSEQTPLFGWMEPNYRPAILVAIASEAAVAVSLALLLVLIHRAKPSSGKSRTVSKSGWSPTVKDPQQRWHHVKSEPSRPRRTLEQPREVSAHGRDRSSARTTARLAPRARRRDRLAGDVLTDIEGS